MALARRAGAGDPAEAGRALTRHLLPHLRENDVVPPGALIAGIWPLPGEIDLRPLMTALVAHGHGLALPVTPSRGNPLIFRRWLPDEPLAKGPMGTRHPEGGEPVHPDLILVPLLAFDRAGRRLGYGGGYYDRTLAALPEARAIGIGFASQEVPEVPAGPCDARLKLVATEAGLIACDALA
jgi:5-formyltetrahydrofolate cyclo-ligase